MNPCKQLGLVDMNKANYLKPSVEINQEQHFVSADITKSWYLMTIALLCPEGLGHLPMQLQAKVKQKDFEVIIKTPAWSLIIPAENLILFI